MLFKISYIRTVVTLQHRNSLQITSGNHYAVLQATAIHPHPNWKPGRSQKLDLGPTWEDVGEIPELKMDMLLRIAASLTCELPDASLNFDYLLYKKFPFMLFVHQLPLPTRWFSKLLFYSMVPLCSSSLKYWLDAWLQILSAFLLLCSSRHFLWKSQPEL